MGMSKKYYQQISLVVPSTLGLLCRDGAVDAHCASVIRVAEGV